eukprot:5097871-Prymnesium_polylepis.1
MVRHRAVSSATRLSGASGTSRGVTDATRLFSIDCAHGARRVARRHSRRLRPRHRQSALRHRLE